uniref:Uncharacterized protein n=1 Tax=Anopheles atroparvus TaxID=41427 RepID=A0AAG5CQ55_ANOAO
VVGRCVAPWTSSKASRQCTSVVTSVPSSLLKYIRSGELLTRPGYHLVRASRTPVARELYHRTLKPIVISPSQ